MCSVWIVGCLCFISVIWDIIDIHITSVNSCARCCSVHGDYCCFIASNLRIWNNQSTNSQRYIAWGPFTVLEKNILGVWKIQTYAVSLDERFAEIEHELELHTLQCWLSSCQLCTFPLPVMHGHRGDISVSEAELIDLTVSLSTTPKIDFCGCYASVSARLNARFLCTICCQLLFNIKNR